nr:MAG TPA: ATP synthase [Caudoviricetes sp.]
MEHLSGNKNVSLYKRHFFLAIYDSDSDSLRHITLPH